MIKVTKLNVNLVKGDKLVAFANVVLNDSIRINGIKVINGSKGLFVAMPNTKKKDKDGTDKWEDIVFPISKEAREALVTPILDEYRKQAQGGSSEGLFD